MNDQVYSYIYERFITLNKEFRTKFHTWKPAPERGEFSILIETETDVFEFDYRGTNNCLLIPLYKKEIDEGYEITNSELRTFKPADNEDGYEITTSELRTFKPKEIDKDVSTTIKKERHEECDT